jgi:phosphate transport system protein
MDARIAGGNAASEAQASRGHAPLEGHIVRGFDGDLMHLRVRVLEMGGLAIEQVNRAVAALVDGRPTVGREVIARADEVSSYARSIEEEIVALIARRQPMASDLRAILTIGRIASDLERVGNGARKIARCGAELHANASDAPLGHFYRDVRKMARLATAMLRDALDCFDRVDLTGAVDVVRRDAEVDAEFQLALRDLVTFVLEDRRWMTSILHTVFVIKSLERIGDHARAIASAVPRLASREEAEALAVPPAPPAQERPVPG